MWECRLVGNHRPPILRRKRSLAARFSRAFLRCGAAGLEVVFLHGQSREGPSPRTAPHPPSGVTCGQEGVARPGPGALQAVVPEWPGVRRGKTLGTVWVPHEGGSRPPSAPVSGGHLPRGPQTSSEDAETTADGMLPDSQVFVCESHRAVVTSTTNWRLKARESILSQFWGLQV